MAIKIAGFGGHGRPGTADGNAVFVQSLDLAADARQRIEAPVPIQKLTETEPDRRSRRLPETQAGPPGKIDAEVANECPRFWLADPDGLEAGRHSNGRLGLGLQRTQGVGAENGVRPIGGLPSDGVPARDFPTRIVNFAKIDIIAQNGDHHGPAKKRPWRL